MAANFAGSPSSSSKRDRVAPSMRRLVCMENLLKHGSNLTSLIGNGMSDWFPGDLPLPLRDYPDSFLLTHAQIRAETDHGQWPCRSTPSEAQGTGRGVYCRHS